MAEHDDVPRSVRLECYERDGGCCRVCGRWVETPGLHHIIFRGQGGLDLPSNLVTIGWTPGHDCHLPYAHGPRAAAFRAALTVVVDHPGVTALQLLRWSAKRGA